jgi:hypothetical protein
MRTRIVIDTLDAADAPEAPFTLNVYRDDDDGTESRENVDILPHGSCLVGADIPAMLRELAAAWERTPLDAIDRDALDDL